MPVDFYVAEGSVRFRVGGRDVSAELRSEAVNRAVSHVSAAPEVRRQVVAWLRGLTKFGPLVMEGRDIGSAVFPDTALKFYLDASPEERARRRHAELAPDAGVSRRAVGDSISRRDRIDSGLGADPLRVSPGAMVIDSTSLSIDEVVRMIVARCRGATR
jgi:cytidylate kinase